MKSYIKPGTFKNANLLVLILWDWESAKNMDLDQIQIINAQ